MKDQRKAEEIAHSGCSCCRRCWRKAWMPPRRADQVQICEQAGISERTLRRYLAQYQAEGFAGLKPRDRNPHRSGDAIPPEILDQAILLRREVPRRSVAQIIQILEWEGLSTRDRSGAAPCRTS